jgi:predicted dehydrogenase
MRKVGIALVGCGYIAQAEHIPALFLLDNVEVRAVVDIREEAAIRIAKQFGAKHFTDLERCLGEINVDAVDICAEKTAHVELGLIAAKAVKHILMEKPIATNINDAKELVREANKHGVKLQVAYMRRFDADCVAIKDLLEKKALGEVRFVSGLINPYSRTAPFGPNYIRLIDSHSAETTRATPLNIFMEVAVHHLNLLRFWLGEVKQVVMAKHNAGVIHLLLEFENETMVNHTTILEGGEYGEEMRLFGTKKSIHARLWLPHFPYEFSETSIFDRETHERKKIFIPRYNAYAAEIRDFANCILEGRAVRSDGADAIRDLELIEEIHRVCSDL